MDSYSDRDVSITNDALAEKPLSSSAEKPKVLRRIGRKRIIGHMKSRKIVCGDDPAAVQSWSVNSNHSL
jgi:hypothetical protein